MLFKIVELSLQNMKIRRQQCTVLKYWNLKINAFAIDPEFYAKERLIFRNDKENFSDTN